MLRRRFVLGAASAAAAVPLATLPGCGGGSSTNEPAPVPPSSVVLHLPADMYMHPGAPTEWWWHTGTLKAGNRVFGFEINAAGFLKDGFAFTQVMVTDVQNNKHYQRTTPFTPPVQYNAASWAESDIKKDWYARLGSETNRFSAIDLTNGGSGYTSAPTVEISGGGGSGAYAIAVVGTTGVVAAVALVLPGENYTSAPTIKLTGGGGSGATAFAYHSYVSMQAPAADPTKNMRVKALLNDEDTKTEVLFDLTFSQQGPPFFVWGTGINPDGTGDTLQTRNYYFSLTRLEASGTITIGKEKHTVSGVTWMDHEYGAFGTSANPVKWFLQDMQLDNGFCISNYATMAAGESPQLNKTTASSCTVQAADGTTWYVPSLVTPFGKTWTSAAGATYFLQFEVQIPGFNATLIVDTPVAAQVFPLPGNSVYEGVASVSGTFRYAAVAGTAWNEQAL